MPNCPDCGKNTLVSDLADGQFYCDRWSCPDANFKSEPVKAPAVVTSAFRREFEERFPSLNFEFICLMDDIGKLGRDKYAENAVENRVKRGDFSRSERIYTPEIARHAAAHFQEYMNGIRHDVYGTRKHQLAAAAFNPMIEFSLAEEK